MTLVFLIVVWVICLVCVTRIPRTILLISLPGTGIFMFVGLSTGDYMSVLLAPGLFLSCYVYVGYFLMAEEHIMARVIARQVLWVVVLFLLLVLVGTLFGAWVMAGILAFVVWLVAMMAYGRTARQSLLFSVLTTLKASMTQNLPLPMALECAAQGRADQEAFVYRQLKKHLVKGYNLVEALRLAMPQCPGFITGVLQGAERFGCLASGLDAVQKNVTLRDRRKQACEPIHPTYPVMVLVILVVIVSALFKFVIPQFSSVMSEMIDGELPAVTQWLLWIWADWSDLVLTGLGIVAGLSVILVLAGWFRRRQRPGLIIVVTDWLRWHLPFIHRFDRMFALIQLLETLNLGLNAGCPVDQAVSHCCRLDVNRCFVRRIRKWHRLIEQGESVSEAALASRLPRALAWAFDSNLNQGNTPSILKMLEETYSDMYVYQSNLLSLIMGPCIVLMLAAMVCFVMVAILLPMVSIITHLVELYP